MIDTDGPLIDFEGFSKRKPSIIKVVGVGGGGCNAVKHMYEQDFADVTFAVCNTDAAALNLSPVEKRLQLGSDGLGVGGDPQKGQLATERSVDDIREMLSDGTRMVFITTGLGGGTGTGGAPVIARIAKEMGILTVGIVTIPFLYEGMNRIDKALLGLEEMTKHVDSLMVINNQRMFEVYPTKTAVEAFERADDTLCVAAKSIVDIIKISGEINPDFNDVRAVLENGGVAIITTAYAEGVDRLNHAITGALNTPLLNSNNIYKSKRLLMTIFTSKASDGEALMITELGEIEQFMQRFDERISCKHAIGYDDSLGKQIKVTILASGFGLEDDPDDEDIYGDEMYRMTKGERLQRLFELFYDRKAKGRPNWNIFVFHSSQLDEDDVISDIETTPTYNRTSHFVGNLRMKLKK
ncbi:MAG: cell division protein FtsZ [Bacteroidaceae bacterium]|nr:cell division protein FtsZ [Bacteroidaceae bacterium]